MSLYRYVNVRCKRCSVRIAGRLSVATGELFAARDPQNDAPEVEGLCISCLEGRDDHNAKPLAEVT